MFRRAVLGLSVAQAVLIAPVLAAPVLAAPVAEVLGSFVWSQGDPDLGGLSSLELTPDGLGFFTASDRGRLFAGRFERNAGGVVIGATVDRTTPLLDEADGPPPGKLVDSEGLATLPDGTIVVSFEQEHRLSFWPIHDAAASVALAPAISRGWRGNQGTEALAAGPDGTLWAVSESATSGAHDVLRFRDGDWLPALRLARTGTWHPVGADFGPDGRLYLLERDFWPFIGFMTRVLRFEATEAGLSSAAVLFETRAGEFDNLEGLATWQDETGATRLTLISDDNFLRLQRTEIVDLRVTE
ncbi:esterase-like activity of phytase family protein [Defluviimonas sp. WL0002]|uniref:Esterase-like activity of phytase family protein n=1 Tax=Albidovulum marisflavi TaxID=2984159 RepID=A0ABT2Z8E1_9RHOB|nr:esterase-like activity of phytase family protein [Defluviimonas sp. WL0002]MCV2867404.1 esterase-like activity of phytase family protein [Defluviimonas sp. WL0002]